MFDTCELAAQLGMIAKHYPDRSRAVVQDFLFFNHGFSSVTDTGY